MDIDEDTNQEEPTCWRTKAIELKDTIAVGSWKISSSSAGSFFLKLFPAIHSAY